MSYTMPVLCRNCYNKFGLDIPKGSLKEDAIKNATCGKCGIKGHCEWSP